MLHSSGQRNIFLVFGLWSLLYTHGMCRFVSYIQFYTASASTRGAAPADRSTEIYSRQCEGRGSTHAVAGEVRPTAGSKKPFHQIVACAERRRAYKHCHEANYGLITQPSSRWHEGQCAGGGGSWKRGCGRSCG